VRTTNSLLGERPAARETAPLVELIRKKGGRLAPRNIQKMRHEFDGRLQAALVPRAIGARVMPSKGFQGLVKIGPGPLMTTVKKLIHRLKISAISEISLFLDSQLVTNVIEGSVSSVVSKVPESSR
jgi:hypothetical protein